MSNDDERIERICESAQKRLGEWGGRWIDKVGPSTENNPALPPDVGRATDIFEYFRLAQVEYRVPGRTNYRLDELSEKVATLAEDYFFGEWRDSFANPDKLRHEWFDELRFGMLFGLMLPDLGSFNRIAAFPTDELPHDDGAWEHTPSDNQVYIALCESLQSDEVQQPAGLQGKRPKAMQQVINAIFMDDEKEFEKQFSGYLAWYKKHEHEDRGNLLISIDGSILLLVAKTRGLQTEHLWVRDREILLAPVPSHR